MQGFERVREKKALLTRPDIQQFQNTSSRPIDVFSAHQNRLLGLCKNRNGRSGGFSFLSSGMYYRNNKRRRRRRRKEGRRGRTRERLCLVVGGSPPALSWLRSLHPAISFSLNNYYYYIVEHNCRLIIRSCRSQRFSVESRPRTVPQLLMLSSSSSR